MGKERRTLKGWDSELQREGFQLHGFARNAQQSGTMGHTEKQPSTQERL